MFNWYSARAADIDNIDTRPATMTEKRLDSLFNIILNSLEHTAANYYGRSGTYTGM
jgi:hypothetical protein